MRTRKEECCVEGLRCNYWVFAFKNQGMGLCWVPLLQVWDLYV